MKFIKKRYIRFKILLLKYRSSIQKIIREGDVVVTRLTEYEYEGRVPIMLDEFKVIENVKQIWELIEQEREKEVTLLFSVKGRLFVYYIFIKRKRHLEDSDFFLIIYFIKYLWLLIGVDKRKQKVMNSILNYYIYKAKHKYDKQELEIREDLLDD